MPKCCFLFHLFKYLLEQPLTVAFFCFALFKLFVLSVQSSWYVIVFSITSSCYLLYTGKTRYFRNAAYNLLDHNLWSILHLYCTSAILRNR
ncbi:hypothetical protein OUZ56_002033 [Daphnia magna]|uniref:Uncharacterized protein n=1 Tax=Daphnia magna TaxID=35525 RepID=A0ABR0A4H2_9CRUS|nr:hypothetical protein OUZ56_002033 [Daphnia magna]